MQRTDQQRKAIEVYCREVASALEREGHTLQDVVREIRKAEITPTQELIKEIVFNGIARAMFTKTSSQLEKSEVTMVYEAMNKWLGQNFSIHVPFPVDKDKISNYDMVK